MTEQVTVVVGAGSLGSEIALRLCRDSTVVVADFRREPMLGSAGRVALRGGRVAARQVDVRDRRSVRALAAYAADRGVVTRLVHAAGVSRAQALPAAILAADMVGPAIVVEEFEDVLADGGAGVVVAGLPGHLFRRSRPDPERDAAIVTARPEDLALLPGVQAVLGDAPDLDAARELAYGLAQHATLLRVRAAAGRWADRGVRLNTVSPGDLAGPAGPADAVEFLLGPGAASITGTDLLVDGGALAAATGPGR